MQFILIVLCVALSGLTLISGTILDLVSDEWKEFKVSNPFKTQYLFKNQDSCFIYFISLFLAGTSKTVQQSNRRGGPIKELFKFQRSDCEA
jgi:hypothetical protein